MSRSATCFSKTYGGIGKSGSPVPASRRSFRSLAPIRAALAREMIAAGLGAILTCVDPKVLDPSFAGREFDARLLDDLPPSVDPCGERGEFHSFAYRGPMFRTPIAVTLGEIVDRDGFTFADVKPTWTFMTTLRRPDDPMTSMTRFPQRIVCLTEETTETLYLLGQGDRIVGVSGYTVRPPEARAEAEGLRVHQRTLRHDRSSSARISCLRSPISRQISRPSSSGAGSPS